MSLFGPSLAACSRLFVSINQFFTILVYKRSMKIVASAKQYWATGIGTFFPLPVWSLHLWVFSVFFLLWSPLMDYPQCSPLASPWTINCF